MNEIVRNRFNFCNSFDFNLIISSNINSKPILIHNHNTDVEVLSVIKKSNYALRRRNRQASPTEDHDEIKERIDQADEISQV